MGGLEGGQWGGGGWSHRWEQSENFGADVSYQSVKWILMAPANENQSEETKTPLKSFQQFADWIYQRLKIMLKPAGVADEV